MHRTLLRLAIAPILAGVATIGCSSSDNGATATDAGTITPIVDAGSDTGPVDAAPPPVAEPPWSGTTIEPGCKANGCIHAFARKQSFSATILKANAASGQTVANGIVEYSITYVSDGAEITGSVFVPDSAAPTEGWSVVVMNQFTSGVGASCAPSVGELSVAVSSATALNGILTFVPDATSYGGATPTRAASATGAYLEGTIAGRAALDGARAAFHTSEALGVTVARKAVIAGLSQGAYSTMAAATAYPSYANELEIRGFVAAEPPSALRSSTNAALKNTTGNLVYDAMRLWSWQGLRGLSGGQIFQAPYDTEAPGWFASDCIFNGNDGSNGTLYNMFYEPVADGGTPSVPIAASSLFTASFLGYAQNDSWPADWTAEYNASLTVPSGLKLPVLIFEGASDVTVLPADVDAYVAQLQAAGVQVDYRKIPNGTHGTTALSSFTVVQQASDQALAWITQTLAN